MPIATLLLRDNATTSLTAIVEKSQQRKPPLPEYNLRLHSCQLDLVLISQPLQQVNVKSTSSDEGFESDIDSLSIVSSDDSFTNNPLENIPKTETDSANGSACSDSDDTDSTSVKKSEIISKMNESFDLVNCVCYADVKFPNLLLFIIKEDVLVFKFDNLDVLHKFYANFNTLKAVSNQKTYGKTISKNTKFNLLQRTDNNGITHIEISREPNCSVILPDNYEPTSIISINAPDYKRHHDNKLNKLNKILDSPKESGLRKVWVSADDLLEEPKKPERRRKPKGKAPEPPVEQKDVLKGEYVRVNVPKVDPEEKIPPADQKLNKAFNILGNVKPKLTTYQQFKYSEPKKIEGGTLTRNRVNLENWTNSVPRLLKSQRSRSETRNFTPMAYRYIDTSISNSPIYNRRYQPMLLSPLPTTNNQISNRLFGMSSKLKEFGGGLQTRYDTDGRSDGRWGSLNELSQKLTSAENNLKSVIKKDENNKRKNEKKVTFSAYTTVQVV